MTIEKLRKAIQIMNISIDSEMQDYQVYQHLDIIPLTLSCVNNSFAVYTHVGQSIQILTI